ncbi:hypothetical protein [Capsulimonas corticalis]|uniref:hypothetical protein n=1 Tax=Capsulimonas corticalis TaxID=2219043 RepID=UPI000E65247B|nr:hypothetical protein [Capsulimonas corticalis]
MTSQRADFFYPLHDGSFVIVAESSTAVLLSSIAEAIGNDLWVYSRIAASQRDSKSAVLLDFRRMQISYGVSSSPSNSHGLLVRLNQAVFTITSFRKIEANDYLQELVLKIVSSSKF